MQALVILLLLCLGASFAPPQVVSEAVRTDVLRLEATASIWLADTTPQERNSSAGQFAIFKLKSIQEMAAIRFDAQPVRGREVVSARLFLHKAGGNMLRYLRVSTVNQDWVAGTSDRPYGPADGATYLWADANNRRAWSYPGSEFADVVMGMGHSITTYAAHRQEQNDWISVPLTPELVYALALNQTDGLAVMDGGNPAYFNNFIHGAQAGLHAPYIEVVAGKPLDRDSRHTTCHRGTCARPRPCRHAAPSESRSSLTPAYSPGRCSSTASPYRAGRCRTRRRCQRPVWSRTTSGLGVPRRSGPVVFYLDTLEPRQIPHARRGGRRPRRGCLTSRATHRAVSRGAARVRSAWRAGPAERHSRAHQGR